MQFISITNIAGKILGLRPVTPLPIDRAKPTGKAPELAHAILVVDRSGSMYSYMKDMRVLIGQILTLEDFRNSELIVTLITYSSSGDTTTHFERVKISKIMEMGSAEQKEIQRLEATMLTSIGGGLEVAAKQVKDGEITGIVLHTDGYANDPSPFLDKRKIDEVVARLSAKNNVVVNTVVYGYGDFPLLDGIAAKCGGKCVAAKTAKEVHLALHAAIASLAGKQVETITLTSKNKDATMFAVSRSARKILIGQNGELKIRGLADSDDVTAYEVGAQIPARNLEASEQADPTVAITMARVELAMNHLNAAKLLVLASRDSSLYPHLRALTAQPIGDFAAGLETALFDNQHAYVEKYGIAKARPTAVEIINLLNANTDGFQVSMPKLTAGYKRRGLKKIPGSRDRATNVIQPPRTKTASVPVDWKSVSGFDMNRNAATINMRVMADQTLHVNDKTGAQITEVGGIPLKLTAFNNYTLIGDGNINVSVLTIRVTDKRLASQLTKLGFSPSTDNVVEIPLGELDVVPMTDVGAELVADVDIVDKIAALRMITSILEASTKGQSTKYTAEQMDKFREFHLTAGGKQIGASIPTTVPYDDKDLAIRQGLIDSYTSYKIDIGTTTIPVPSEVMDSANEGVKRYYEVTDKEGKKVEKPSMLDVVAEGATVKEKAVKTPTAVDKVQKPWFDQFASLSKKGPWNEFLTTMGLDEDEVSEFLDWRKLSADRRVEVFKKVVEKAKEYSNLLFAQVLAPTVIYMGSTGFLPDAIDATVYTPEDFAKKFGIKLIKALQEATFFVLPDNRVLSVRPEIAWFSTPAGVEAIKKAGSVAEDD